MLRNLWLQHDCAAVHKSIPVHRFLMDMFGINVIGYVGSVECHRRSLEVSLVVFFMKI